jgi:hypothetical protein
MGRRHFRYGVFGSAQQLLRLASAFGEHDFIGAGISSTEAVGFCPWN